MRKTTLALAMALLIALAVPVLAGTETQNFSTNPSDWEARSVTGTSYSDTTGWSNTNTAGAAAGEGQAKFHRLNSTGDGLNENVAWYADRNLGGTLDVSTQALTASGQLCVTDFASYPDLGNGVWLGWFRPGGGCRMGIMLNDNGGAGLGWYAGIYNNYGQLIAQQFMGSVAANLKYSFYMEFDNNEGAYGQGRLVARMTPEGYSMEQSVIHLTSKLSNYEFSAFGLSRPNPSPYAPWEYKAIDMRIDDLAYTSNLPEPGTLAALASGLLGMIGLGIRRRK